MAWNRTLDEDDILFREHFHNLQTANFHLGVTHVTTHTHAFHYFRSERRVTQGAGSAQTVVLAVCLLHDTTEAVPLNYTLETFTFGGAGDHTLCRLPQKHR